MNKDLNKATDSAAAAGQPPSVVLGDWLANTHRDEIMRDIDLWWTDIPDDVKNNAQNPHAPPFLSYLQDEGRAAELGYRGIANAQRVSLHTWRDVC